MPAVDITRLSKDTTSADLTSVFNSYSLYPAKISLPQDSDTGKCRGFAFATFNDAEDARTAESHIDGVILHGNQISVRPHASGPVGGGGYGMGSDEVNRARDRF